MRQHLLPFLLLCSAVVCQAQIHQMTRNDSAAISHSYNLNPVVVTGSGHHQRLKSTATPVHVLSAQEIREQGISTFDGALTRMMPQVSMAPNSMGTFLRLNGLGNKYILILINGQKLNGDISNNVDLNRINMARVKRIEVLDGAASSLYGSDAIAGVINIITDQPTQDLISITSNTRVSGHGILTESVSLDIFSKGFGSYTSFSHDRADSYRNNPPSPHSLQVTVRTSLDRNSPMRPTSIWHSTQGWTIPIRSPRALKHERASQVAPTMRCVTKDCVGTLVASISSPAAILFRPISLSIAIAMVRSTMWQPRLIRLATMCNRRNSA